MNWTKASMHFSEELSLSLLLELVWIISSEKNNASLHRSSSCGIRGIFLRRAYRSRHMLPRGNQWLVAKLTASPQLKPEWMKLVSQENINRRQKQEITCRVLHLVYACVSMTMFFWGLFILNVLNCHILVPI